VPYRPFALVACLIVGLHGQSADNSIPTFGTTVVISSGLRGEIFYLHKGTSTLPDFNRLKPAGVIWTTSLNVRPHHWRNGFPGITKRFEWFGINYTGRFWIDNPGLYKFALLSDDGSKLYIDDQEIVDNDCQHPPDVRGVAINLSGGIHRIRIGYFQGPRDCVALILAVAGPGGDWHIFNTDDFKPPPNPENWKYPEATASIAPENNEGENLSRDDVLDISAGTAVEPETHSHNRRHRWDPNGCYAPPTRFCGK
jgi:hypothetical protein